MDEPIWVSEALALAIHARQIAEHGGEDGLRDPELLSSALSRRRNQFVYERDSVDLARLAAAYLFGIAKNHPFIDGNNRVALVVAGVFVRLNGFRLQADLSELYAMVLGVASGEVDEELSAQWIRERMAIA